MQESENQRAFRVRVEKIEAQKSAAKTDPKAARQQRNTSASRSKRGTYTLLTILVLCIAGIPSLMKSFPSSFALPEFITKAANDGAEPTSDLLAQDSGS